ncbi:MFS general substrate transporter [Glarea lozoyensis ATCC 20868]|uniref:MFS general substrate transporter n=1 Tax=Glarea lozoyensis (strain ATCC 20868 / MF5171) TaxID=1116229 RepID=S3CV66_GLAL2|nr:MFS general substrate transporter [Glarea lozoyensis ATCC 20868]EPE28849.1 MFS general substrate transporter [Glarea lozoyensis ATCC 20868]
MLSKNAYLWYSCMVIANTMILYGYDSSTFNAVQGSKNWQKYFHEPDPNVIGSVNTAYTVGGIVAGLFFSAPISDRWGRKIAIIVGCLVVIIATFVSTFTPRHIGGYIGGRALVGIGQGIALPAGPVYISELAPSTTRGKIMSFWQMNFSVGSFMAYWSAARLGDWDWKTVMICHIAPVLIIANIWHVPESPRWLVQKDRTEDALAALQRLRDSPEDIEFEMQEMHHAMAFEKEAISGAYMPLWTDKTVRYRLMLAIVLNVGQQLTGQGSLNNYSTIIYKKVFSDNSQIQLINALNGTFGILFTLNATWTVDRFGRRFLFLVGAAGMAVSMLVAAAVVTETPEYAGGAKSRSVGITTVFLMFLFAFFFKPSWGAVTWIWIGEVFSMNVRSQAVAISAQSQNVANAVLQQVFPLFLAKKGFYAMYLFFGINIVLFVFVWYMIPETKNKTLETMDVLFGGVNHADKGVMMEEDGKVQELTENIELVESRKSHDAEQIKQAGATKEIKV